MEKKEGSEHLLRSSLHRVVRGGALGMAGMITGALLNLVLVFVITRGLGPHGAGLFFETVALFSILTTVAAFGADTGFVRTVSRYKAIGRIQDLRRALVVGLGPVTALSLVFALGIVVWADQLVELLAPSAPDETVGHLRLLAPFIPFATGAWVCLAATRGFGTMVPYVALENLGKPLVRPLLAMGAVAAGWGAGAIAIAWALPVALELPLAVGAVAVLLKRVEMGHEAADSPPRPIKDIAAEFWRFSLARGLASVFQVAVTWLDVLLVGLFLGPRAAGIYAVVSRLTLAGKLMLDAIRLAVAPEMSAMLARGNREDAGRLYRVASIWTIAPSWPVYLALVVFAPTVLGAFGPEFVAGADALRILCVAMLFNLGTGEVTTVLLMGGKSSWNLANNSVSVAVNVTLNLLLIPRWGIEGAAVAWAVSILVENLAPLVQIGVLMDIRLFSRGYFQIVGYALACFGALGVVIRYLVGDGALGLWIAMGLGLLAYLPLLFASRGRFQFALLKEALLPRLRGSRNLDKVGPPPVAEPEKV